MSEITKKLSLKKTFFITQLESFFSSISSEFQQKISSLEIENSLLKEKNQKLEYDVKNLVKIKNDLLEKTQKQEQIISNLKNELEKLKNTTDDSRNIELIRQNNQLKKENDDFKLKIDNLKQKISNLQTSLKKGVNAYNETLLEKKKEEVIKEIAKNIKKDQ